MILVHFPLQSFYTFCTYVAWIVFRRQCFTEIEEEIGRLFRTNMFNIPRRKREDEESGGEKKRMTFVQFRYDLLTFLSSKTFLENRMMEPKCYLPIFNRRMMAKRPAIKKAIYMRSPVLSTLLPSLREKAQNVFEKKCCQGDLIFSAQEEKYMENLDSVHMPM